MGEKFRLDRYLAECGTGTRSEVKSFIRKGRVSVNGAIARDSGMKVDSTEDTIIFDGQPLCYEKYQYFMLNKPAGCVSATRDGLSSTVLDLLEGEITRGLFPVGRLDKDTEGLLLITNDGPLGHDLLSPRKHVDKTYLAYVDAELSDADLEAFRQGVDIGDEKLTLPAEIEPENDISGRDREIWLYRVVIREGRYHQVKRMFEVFGSTVVYLKRVSMGTLNLDSKLEPGEYRKLNEEEVALLKGE